MRVVKSAKERKNEILDVAERLIEERGFDNTSTNDIIDEIGIARGTLYHHFKSKEEILDALIERMTVSLVSGAKTIAGNADIPLLQRFTGVVTALNVEGSFGKEVLTVVHKPQNALLHQKMQESLMKEVVPIIAGLIIEGCESGQFTTAYPTEAAEFILIYSNEAFDDRNGLSEEETMRKLQAFIYHTERILGSGEGELRDTIMKMFIK